MKRLIVLGTVALCAAVFAGEFKAGFSRKDITPPLGVFMPGYYQKRYAKEILDPLQINCAAFSDGTKTALVMQFDTEALSDWVADGMRDAIVKATGIDRDAILLHASHTHDGGHLAAKQKLGASSCGQGEDALTLLYVQMSTTRAADAAVEAIRRVDADCRVKR